MKRSVVIRRLGYEASAALDNLRYIARRAFHSFRASQRDVKAPQKISGYASLPARSLGERRIYRNQTWVRFASGLGATDSDQ